MLTETTNFFLGAINALLLAVLSWAIIGTTIYRLVLP